MALTLCEATESDANRIADIHMAAFGSNLMLLAQFPNPSVRKELWVSLVNKTIGEIRDPKWAVLLVRDENGEIVSFAKWCLPIHVSENYVESPWEWPEGTDMKVLNEWTEIVENAERKVLGDEPCYRLSFMGTDPKHERRGAASLLLKWGIERSNAENVPIALEGTKNAALFYEHHGFKAEKHISIVLNGFRNYEETCYVFRPSNQTADLKS
ncbi:hypothetical protein AJ80_01398 [Polytolypa hystricis UAMH7299]|uniref:N-acetyltransferase domain-containing protein n=1 Tax=Polytolypa hystricis (strain UAMH7299) TaxID=1447883 RepID=A0A2B7Z0H5_POLH7|nr:hypothetical protein AJ80_01398 [Polytolypa hystricis UAMH7299]